MRILAIPDMSCEHCVNRITTCLDEVIEEFVVDLATKTVSFEGCDNCVAKAITALAAIDYPAEEIIE